MVVTFFRGYKMENSPPQPTRNLTDLISFEYKKDFGPDKDISSTKLLIAGSFVDILTLLLKSEPKKHAPTFLFGDISVNVDFLRNCKLLSRGINGESQSLWLCYEDTAIQLFTRMFALLHRVHDNIKCSFTVNTEQNVLDALESYIKVGELIRTSGSNEFFQLNDLIVNFDQSTFIKNEIIRSRGLDPKRMFIAVTTPSFTGKTQLAFSLIEKKPLYFVLGTGTESQLIYKNFRSISAKLSKYVLSDLKSFKKRPSFFTISKSHLLERPDRKYKSLGFIFALMEESSLKYSDTSTIPWMKFFSDRRVRDRQTLRFQKKSINDCKNDPKFKQFTGNFFIFLDEFPPKKYAAFLRNLFCAVEITCVVSATNTKGANLIGLKSSHGSRSAESTIWCVVISKLPLRNVGLVDEFNEVKSKFTILANQMIDTLSSESTKLYALLNFFEYQLKVLRPGIAIKALKYLKEATDLIDPSTANFSSSVFFHVLDSLAKYIKELKGRIVGSSGLNAHIALFSSTSYISQYVENNRELNRPNFINDHLYFLSNPAPSISSIMFLLWPSTADEAGEDPASLDYSEDVEAESGLKRGEKQHFDFKSYFDPDEIILALSCFLIKPKSSTSRIIYFGTKSMNRENSNAGFCLSPKASVNSGQLLENVAVCSFIQASHLSMKGSNGSIFLNEVIRNLIIKFKSGCSVQLEYADAALEDQLNSFSIPYLYISNMQIPSLLKALFNCGSFSRTSNTEKIDAIFDVYKSGDLASAIIECKDYSRRISVSKFINIMEKGALHSGLKLHFTVCNSIGGMKGKSIKNIKKLQEFAEANSFNIIRIVRSKKFESHKFSYQVAQYRSDFKYFVDPIITFIIIELDEINHIKSAKM